MQNIPMQSALSSVQRQEYPSEFGLRRHKEEEPQSTLSHGLSAIYVEQIENCNENT